jgi:hypothetical protein
VQLVGSVPRVGSILERRITMAKKRTGGRVTPKGTQPATPNHKRDHATSDGSGSAPRALPAHVERPQGRAASGPIGPTRSGHHRGNR